MKEDSDVEKPYRASLRSMMDLLEKRDPLFPWEAAFALKIKTTEALQMLSEMVKQGDAEQFIVESNVKECTGMGCIGCDCTNIYVRKETKYRKLNCGFCDVYKFGLFLAFCASLLSIY